jgi:hypothetical protein
MKNIIVIWLLLYNTSSIAQIVCDSMTKIPIENVNIISNDNIGTITNEQGNFTLKYFDDFKFLSFSHLIYSSKKIEKSKIKELDTIFLNPSIVNLDEVVLKIFNAKDTLVKAIKNIPVNYSFKPFNLNGFYRESIIEDTTGIAMTEVSFRTYNEEVDSNAEILRGRRTENYSTSGFDLLGGVYNMILKGDMVRQQTAMLDLNNISNYNFKYIGSVDNWEGTAYIINYEPANDGVFNNRKGQLFIDSETLAITQIISKRDNEKMKKILKNIDPKIFESKKILVLTDVNAIVKYKKNNDNKYYLSFIDGSNNLKGLYKNKSHDYELYNKLIITQINTTNPKKVNTNYNIKKSFNEQVKKIPKLEYWNENNTLLFSVKESKILNDIKNATN